MHFLRDYAPWITGVAGLLLIALTTQTWLHASCFALAIIIWACTDSASQQEQQNHPENSKSARKIQKQFDKVGRQLSAILREETHIIHENMERIKNLIHESTEHLNSSFCVVASNTRKQKVNTRELGGKLAAINDPDNKESVTASLEQACALLNSMTEQLGNIKNNSQIAGTHIGDTTVQLQDVSALLNDILILSRQSYLLVTAGAYNEDNARELLDKLTTICTQIDRKIKSSQATVDETSRLVGDINAVDINTFSEEREIIAGLLDNIEGISRHTSHAVADLAKTSESISLEIDKSIQAIQFEDIVNQLSSGMQFRLDHINEISNTIFPHSTAPHEIDYHLDYASKKLIELRDEFHSKRIGEKVVQSSMAEGDIELF
jgi:hypothetical protein